MTRTHVVLLYAFVALAIVFRLGVSIGHVAYAQMWDLAPNVQIQSQSDNNLQLNKNVIQHDNINNNVNNKNSIAANCITTESNIINATVGSRLSSGLVSSPSKISSNCAPNDNNNNVNNKNSIAANCITQESNIVGPTVASRLSSGLTSSAPKTSSNCDPLSSSGSSSAWLSKFHNPCIKLKVKNSDGLKVPAAQTIRYGNVTKAISTGSTLYVQEICGTNHGDYIIGSEGADIIFGLRGNDIITALGGDDLVYAGPGDDIVYGGDGNNQLFGQDGNDNLVGGTQDDLIVGGPGNDRLYGNSGDDILQGQQGADYFDCGDGLDTVVDYTPTQGDVISVNCENVNLVH